MELQRNNEQPLQRLKFIFPNLNAPFQWKHAGNAEAASIGAQSPAVLVPGPRSHRALLLMVPSPSTGIHPSARLVPAPLTSVAGAE